MQSTWQIILLTTVSLVGSSCLFTSIGEDLDQQSCRGESATFCTSLNTSSPTGDPCLYWSCSPQEGVCKILPLDEDGDGAPAKDCAPAGVTPDCDDKDSKRTPEVAGVVKQEICDGIDNNCNEIIDEGAYVLEKSKTLLKTETLENFSVVQINEATHQFVYSNTKMARQASTLNLTPLDLKLQDNSSDTLTQGTAQALTKNKKLIVATASSGNQVKKLRIGILDQTEDKEWKGAEVEVAGNNISHLAIAPAADSSAFVGGYLDHEVSPEDFCKTPSSSLAETPVYLFLGDSNDFSTDFKQIDLGVTVDPSAPAIIAMSESEWLVAKVNANKIIEVHRIKSSDFSEGEPSIQGSPLFTLTFTEEPGDLSLQASNDRSKFALTYRTGCGTPSEIGVTFFSVLKEGLLLPSPPPLELATGANLKQPQVLWQQTPSEGWLVSWTERNSTAKMASISIAGKMQGTPYTLVQDQGNINTAQLVHAKNNDIVSYSPLAEMGVIQTKLSCKEQ